MVLEHNSSLPLPPPPLCLHTSLSLSLGKLFHNTIWHFAGPLGLTHTSDDSHRFWGIEVIQILPIGCWNSGAGVKVQVRSSCSYVIPQPGHPSLLSFISFFFFFPFNLSFNECFWVQLFMRWNARQLVIDSWLLSWSILSSLSFIKALLCARNWTEHFICIRSFNLESKSVKPGCLPYLVDKETGSED